MRGAFGRTALPRPPLDLHSQGAQTVRARRYQPRVRGGKALGRAQLSPRRVRRTDPQVLARVVALAVPQRGTRWPLENRNPGPCVRSRSWVPTNPVDRTESVLYKESALNGRASPTEGRMAMRKLVTLVLVFGFLFGAVGTALACAGASEADVSTPTSQQPRPQT